MTNELTETPAPDIEELILEVRGQKVMLDQDLAELYGVATKALNQAVTRNSSRFPADFTFQLTRPEYEILRSQTVTSRSPKHGGRRYTPRVFTEEGVAMLSSVLRSERAVAANVAIMRAFVKLRQVFTGHEDLLRRLDALERRVGTHDTSLRAIFAAIRKLVSGGPVPPKRRIGFEEE